MATPPPPSSGLPLMLGGVLIEVMLGRNEVPVQLVIACASQEAMEFKQCLSTFLL